MENGVQSISSLKCQLDEVNTMLGVTSGPGVYKVIRMAGGMPNFKDTTTAISSYKGKSMLYDSKTLIIKHKNQFLKGVEIDSIDRYTLYIGKAKNLFRRICQLVEYAYGESEVHRGGRALWQMENWEDELYIEIIPCENPEDEEKRLLVNFKEEFGDYPLANWRK